MEKQTYQKVKLQNFLKSQFVVTELSPDFRKVTKVVSVPIPKPKPNEVFVKNLYLGINASDVNFTSGKYTPGLVPPFDCGFEAIGKVVAVGSSCKLKVGQAVACSCKKNLESQSSL
jgi:prostaglandin reductase 3